MTKKEFMNSISRGHEERAKGHILSRSFFISFLLVLVLSSQGLCLSVIERRRPQEDTEGGHLLTPAAANIPGIGFTYGLLGAYFNIKETEADAYGFYFLGDLIGKGVGLVDSPIGIEHLSLDLGIQRFDKIGVQTYKRGIDSDPDDRIGIELDKFDLLFSQLKLKFFEKRLRFNVGWNQQKARLSAVYDKEGDKITDIDQSTATNVNFSGGVILDITDDNSDPRKGVQFETYYYDRPRARDYDADSYIMSYNVLGYIPIGKHSTWVFNVFKSDAVVTDKGDVDPASVKSRLGYQCNTVDPSMLAECLQKEEQEVNETIAANRYGTADPLGGTQRLRSYVTSRFKDAHSLFYGSEIRWNVTDEYSKFNIYLASGVRTSIQLAAFAGIGSVAQFDSDLHKKFKKTYGVGIRLVAKAHFIWAKNSQIT